MLDLLRKNRVLVALLVFASSYIYWFVPMYPYFSTRNLDIFAIVISGAAIVVLTEFLFLYIKELRWHVLINIFLISVPFSLLAVTGYIWSIYLLPFGETTVGSYYDIGMFFLWITMLVSVAGIFLIQRALGYFSNNQFILKAGGLLILAFFIIMLWYTSLPVLVAVYLFVYEQRLSVKTKVAVVSVCGLVSIFLGVQFLEATRVPSITVFTQSDIMHQETLVLEGVVTPSHTSLSISEYKGRFPSYQEDRLVIETDKNGYFNHPVTLSPGSNEYIFCFENFYKSRCKQYNFERAE